MQPLPVTIDGMRIEADGTGRALPGEPDNNGLVSALSFVDPQKSWQPG